jgi:copper chaperone CopZ
MLGCAATLEIERKVQSMSQMTQRNTEELKVAEMTCGSCVVHVGEALKGVDGVSSADVDLESGTARVHGERLDRDALVAAIRAEGYDVAIPEE